MKEFLKQNKNEQSDKFSETLVNSSWLGIVVDADDNKYLGRCKIRVFEKFDGISIGDIPWAFPKYSPVFAGGDGGCGSFSYPKEETIVRVTFEHGDIYAPEYEVVQDMNKAMQAEIKESYVNSQVIRYDEDEDMKIIYTQKNGLMIWNKHSYININNDGNIIVSHAGNSSETTYVDGDIALASMSSVSITSPTVFVNTDECRLGNGAAHPVAKGDDLVELLMKMALLIDGKVPVTPGACLGLVTASNVLSTRVTVAE